MIASLASACQKRFGLFDVDSLLLDWLAIGVAAAAEVIEIMSLAKYSLGNEQQIGFAPRIDAGIGARHVGWNWGNGLSVTQEQDVAPNERNHETMKPRR